MNIPLLNTLVNLYGPSGHEHDVLDFCVGYVKDHFHNSMVTRDRFDNLIIHIHPQISDAVVLMAHADQIGVVITFVDADGFARFRPVGGWDPAVFVGQRVMIYSEETKTNVYGVITRRGIHLMDDDDDMSINVDDIWIDLGIFTEDTPNTLVDVGDAGIIMPPQLLALPGGAFTAQAFDDRIGIYVALCVAEEISALAPTRGLIVIINRNEESGNFEAAKAAADVVTHGGERDYPVIAIDVTAATDQPDISKEKHGDIVLGAGPAIAVGGLLNRKMINELKRVASTLEIGVQRTVVTAGTGTDLDGVFTVVRGVRGAVLSIPCRYLHTPVEMVSEVDVNNAIDLLLGFCLND